MKTSNFKVIALASFGLLFMPGIATHSSDAQASTTINTVGCLARGEMPHEYSVTTANGATYGLLPENGINISKHVGEKVMVTGTVTKAKRARREATESGAPADSQYLRVEQVKMVSPSCS
jgi:hypothetical protein